MSNLYGKGTISEIVKGKKYRLALSAGKDPRSGRVYASGNDVPGKACALDRDGKQVRPRITWEKAPDEQRAEYALWQAPVEYLRHQETFLGTKRQAELRIEVIRREMELTRDCLELGLSLDELASYGLSVALSAEMGMSAAQVCDELQRRKDDESKQMVFSDWIAKYLSVREGLNKKRKRTLDQDRYNSKHLIRGLGDMRLAEITPAVVNDLYVKLRADGMGDTTLLQCHRLLKRVMSYALDNDLIMRNPVDRVETPKKPKPQRRALSSSDAQRLGLICSQGIPTANKTAVFLGLSLGARLGEILGLTWGHVALDAERPFAHIVQQHTRANERTPLKTDSDDNPIGRVVPLDASTVAYLKAWRGQQRAELNALGIEPGTGTPIITSPLGCWQGHAKFTKWWQSFCVENGFGRWVADDGREIKDLIVGDDASLYPDCVIEWRDSRGWPCDESGRRFSRTHRRPEVKRHYDGLKFHELRHTHFTLRLASGMDIPTAQALGGWSTPDVLMSVYAHPVSQNVWDSVGFMDELTQQKARC